MGRGRKGGGRKAKRGSHHHRASRGTQCKALQTREATASRSRPRPHLGGGRALQTRQAGLHAVPAQFPIARGVLRPWEPPGFTLGRTQKRTVALRMLREPLGL